MVRSLALLGLTLGVHLSGCAGGGAGWDDAGSTGDWDHPANGGNGMRCEELDKGDAAFKSVVDQLEQQGLANSRAIAIALFVKAGRLDAGMTQCP